METSKEQENEACQIAYEIPVENNGIVILISDVNAAKM